MNSIKIGFFGQQKVKMVGVYPCGPPLIAIPGSRIAGERKVNDVRQPVPVAAVNQRIKIRRLAHLPGISGAHLQQVPDCDLLFPRIIQLSGEFRDESF